MFKDALTFLFSFVFNMDMLALHSSDNQAHHHCKSNVAHHSPWRRHISKQTEGWYHCTYHYIDLFFFSWITFFAIITRKNGTWSSFDKWVSFFSREIKVFAILSVCMIISVARNLRLGGGGTSSYGLKGRLCPKGVTLSGFRCMKG